LMCFGCITRKLQRAYLMSDKARCEALHMNYP
jgi:hypothetical protein